MDLELGPTLAIALALTACVPAAGDGDAETLAESTAETRSETTASAPDLGESGGESETGDECPPPPCEPCTCVEGVLDCACTTLEAEAGFIELAGVAYELGAGPDATAMSSTDSRQFWAFAPCERDAESAPLLVFFNGGPGVSSGMLLGLSTGPASFAPSLTGPDAAVVQNPHSWTSFANLLWIDARQTGFSHGLLDDPSDDQLRADAMSVDSFNSYRDAADFVRTLLAFLDAHPSLRDNEVVLVAESYGGIRAQIMLDMLLFPQRYQDGSRKLRDDALAEQIVAHHQELHGLVEGPATVAAQFGRQILIQPALTGSVQEAIAGALYEQPGSIIEQLAAQLGVDYPSCAEQGGPCDPYDNAISFVGQQGRSAYDYRAPSSWLAELFELVGTRLNDVTATEALLGVDARSIVGLAASERAGAWRAANLGGFPPDAELGDWPEVAGSLEPWDRYFAIFNIEALSRFHSVTARNLDVDPADPHFGELLLSNLVWVDTLVTEAAYDLVIYTPAIPIALESYDQIVDGVIVDTDAQQWTIEYRDDVFGAPGARVVTVPRYEASHAVTLDAPEALRSDVETWLGGG